MTYSNTWACVGTGFPGSCTQSSQHRPMAPAVRLDLPCLSSFSLNRPSLAPAARRPPPAPATIQGGPEPLHSSLSGSLRSVGAGPGWTPRLLPSVRVDLCLSKRERGLPWSHHVLESDPRKAGPATRHQHRWPRRTAQGLTAQGAAPSARCPLLFLTALGLTPSPSSLCRRGN